jgi:hypothetical protein
MRSEANRDDQSMILSIETIEICGLSLKYEQIYSVALLFGPALG